MLNYIDGVFMKKIVFVILFTCVSSFASNIAWSGNSATPDLWVTNTSETSASYFFRWHVINQALYPCLGFTVSKERIKITMSANEDHQAAYGDNWMEVKLGDNIGYDTIRGSDKEYFSLGFLDSVNRGSEIYGDYDITLLGLNKTHSVILGFGAINEMSGEVPTYTTADINNVHYGWVEFLVTGTNVELGQYAINLDGGSAIVAGQIPEPTTCTLTMIGMLLLFKRRRVASNIAK